MVEPLARVYFDFVDPLSYLLSLEAGTRTGTASPRVEWRGFELCPPPTPLTTTDDLLWRDRWEAAWALANERGVALHRPRLVPWTRKAHELQAFAGAHGVGDTLRAAVFEAYFAGGRDIGRVDVLVDLAARVGLDATEAKAVLDVDRHEGDVRSARDEALALGVENVPTLWADGRLAEGFPDPSLLGTLLPDR